MATIAVSRSMPAGLSAKSDAPSSHQYTCNTCQVAFRFADTQKGHMKSDWHRYNLKRRVASLPPISSEVFTEKVLQARAATSAEADKAGFQQVCDVCQKSYFSENSYRNHIASQKHKAKLHALQRKGSVADHDESGSVMSSTFSLGEPLPQEVDSDAEDEFTDVVNGIKKANLNDVKRPATIRRPSNPHPSAEGQHQRQQPISDVSSETKSSTATPVPSLTLKSCLFCNYDSPTVALSVVHMERIHGMFIPEKQYLVNLDGLIKSLQERIQELCECLYCGKMKNNSFAVQTHMRDKGHCKIPYTTEEEQLEIGEFYDFRSTYSDGEDDSEDESVGVDKQGGAKLGAKRPTKAVGEDGDEIMEDDEGWETDSSASSCDSEFLTSIPVDHAHQYERLDKHHHHSSHDPRRHHQVDGWHSHAHNHHAVFYDDTQLHLPSGRSVGHRSLNKYYRQNLHSHPSPEERAERLAIAAANPVDPMDDDSENRSQVATRNERGRNGSLVTRANGGTGMAGVSDQKKNEVKRAELRARKKQQNAEKRGQWLLNKQNNSQKYYTPQML